MVQRYLVAKSRRGATTAVVLSGLVVCLQFAMFLGIGVGLACFYQVFPPETPFAATDNVRVFAHFVVHHLGVGLVGLTLAAVFAAAMSTLSSSLNSSATSLINDLYLPLSQRELSPAEQLRLSRWASAGFGILQIAIAVASYEIGANQSTVNSVLKIRRFCVGADARIVFPGGLRAQRQTACSPVGLRLRRRRAVLRGSSTRCIGLGMLPSDRAPRLSVACCFRFVSRDLNA